MKFTDQQIMAKAVEERFFLTDRLFDWLPGNLDIFRAFCARTDELYFRGHKNYAAQGIVLVLRFQWMTKTNCKKPFNVDNFITADCARLYAFLHPERAHVFRYVRDRTKLYARINELLEEGKKSVSRPQDHRRSRA